MKYLFNYIDEALGRLKEARKVVLLLDYDGTLTPIVRRPELAKLKESNRKLLLNLRKKLILGIISGRSLKDIKGLVRISGIIYTGNHGLEIEFRRKKYILPAVKKFPKLLDRIAGSLTQGLGHIKGIIVEHKGLTLSIHYRCVNRLRQAEVKRIFNRVVNPFLGERKFKVTCGKKVFEIRPPVEWNKGRAVAEIIRKLKSKVLAIYIGDDITDEDAFRAIGNKGITVFVGRSKKSYAEYFVWSVDEVIKFLRKIDKCRK